MLLARNPQTNSSRMIKGKALVCLEDPAAPPGTNFDIDPQLLVKVSDPAHTGLHLFFSNVNSEQVAMIKSDAGFGFTRQLWFSNSLNVCSGSSSSSLET